MADNNSSNFIKIDPKKITVFLFAIAGLLLFAHLVGQIEKYVFNHPSIYGLVPLFNLDYEYNIPTLFQSVTLVFTSIILAVISLLETQKKDRKRGFWIALSLGFSYMGVDEWFEFHEKLTQPLRDWIGANSLGVFYFSWVIIGLVIVTLIILFFARFVLHLDNQTRNTFILAAGLFIAGTIGFELIGGVVAESHGTENLIYNLLVAGEESLEMSGVIVFINGLLSYISRTFSEFSIRMVNDLSV